MTQSAIFWFTWVGDFRAIHRFPYKVSAKNLEGLPLFPFRHQLEALQQLLCPPPKGGWNSMGELDNIEVAC